MNFLQIVQSVSRITGTGDVGSITTTANASGSVATLVELTQAAWTAIQLKHRAWRFMVVNIPETVEQEGEADPAPLVIEEDVHTLTAASLNLANWSEWIPGDEEGTVPMTVWPANPERRGQETVLVPTDYRRFRQQYQFGSSVSQEQRGQPRVMAVDNQDRLVVWPTPDQDYRLDGTYRRLPQVFAADTDIPIISAEHHDAIIWEAALLVLQSEEAEPGILFTTKQEARNRMAALRRKYIPFPHLQYKPLGSGRSGYVGPLSPPNPTFAG